MQIGISKTKLFKICMCNTIKYLPADKLFLSSGLFSLKTRNISLKKDINFIKALVYGVIRLKRSIDDQIAFYYKGNYKKLKEQGLVENTKEDDELIRLHTELNNDGP